LTAATAVDAENEAVITAVRASRADVSRPDVPASDVPASNASHSDMPASDLSAAASDLSAAAADADAAAASSDPFPLDARLAEAVRVLRTIEPRIGRLLRVRDDGRSSFDMATFKRTIEAALGQDTVLVIARDVRVL
jgi:hypothetical protein